ncbi:MAG: glycosyltransferase family 9 protein [Desulfosudaceae bacterium]
MPQAYDGQHKETLSNGNGSTKWIAAVSPGGLGDTILFSPVLKALRTCYPRAFIELVAANALVPEMYSTTHIINAVTVANTNRPWWHPAKTSALAPLLMRARRDNRDKMAVFATGLSRWWPRLFHRVGSVPHCLRAPLPEKDDTNLSCNLELARRFDKNVAQSDVFVDIPADAHQEARDALLRQGINIDTDKLMAVYPSRETPKHPRWPLANQAAVLHRLRRDIPDVRIVIVGGLNEGKDWDRADTGRTMDANLAGNISIGATAAILARCRLALCNEGGPMHLAGAVGCPLVATIPGAPPAYQPPGRQSLVFRTCTHGDFSIQQITDACLRLLCQNPLPESPKD